MDIEQIKRNYESFDDMKIELLAKNEVGSLEPEVIPIIINEIKKRNLDIDLLKGIEGQTNELTESELLEVKLKIESLPCPECGSRKSKLVGTLIRTVKSFVIVTTYNKTPVITCEICANSKKKSAMISTALLGWWAIPWGLLKTPIALISTLIDNGNKKQISDEIIAVFSINNIGEIRTNWDKESELINFIKHRNTQE